MPRKDKDTAPLYTDRLVGKALHQRRSQRGLSQQAVGKELNLSFQQIQKYENGANRISASRLLELANLLECTPNYFFGLDDTPKELDMSGKDQGRLALLNSYNSIKSPKRRAIIRHVAHELSREEN